MKLKTIIRHFKDGNTCVTGLRGRGKDMLIANVVCRRKKDYISNVDYTDGVGHFDFVPDNLNLAMNTYHDFICGTVKKYSYPYPDGVDVYISDAGIYFPSQYQGELCKRYPHFPTFMALSRQLGECNVHVNVQNLNRCWDKIREQSDTFINCDKCLYIKPLKLVIQRVTIYTKEESCTNRVEPFLIKPSLLCSAERREQIEMKRLEYKAAHGDIKRGWLIYRNKSNYNTRIFKEILENGI